MRVRWQHSRQVQAIMVQHSTLRQLLAAHPLVMHTVCSQAGWQASQVSLHLQTRTAAQTHHRRRLQHPSGRRFPPSNPTSLGWCRTGPWRVQSMPSPWSHQPVWGLGACQMYAAASTLLHSQATRSTLGNMTKHRTPLSRATHPSQASISSHIRSSRRRRLTAQVSMRGSAVRHRSNGRSPRRLSSQCHGTGKSQHFSQLAPQIPTTRSCPRKHSSSLAHPSKAPNLPVSMGVCPTLLLRAAQLPAKHRSSSHRQRRAAHTMKPSIKNLC